MPRPVVSDIAERMYEGLTPLAFDDHLNNYALLHFCEAFIGKLQQVEDIVRDDQTIDAPGWSILLDIDRCPYEALPWLGQFVGVTTPEKLPGETDEEHEARVREYIRTTGGFDRGTPASIIGAVQQFLSGDKEVILTERDSSPYHFLVASRYSQTPTAEWAATNILGPSKSFEGGVTTGWSLAASDVTGATFDTFQHKYAGSDGSYVGRIGGTVAPSTGFLGISNLSTLTSPVVAGTVYTASCYCELLAGVARNVIVRINWLDVSNATVGSLEYGDPELLSAVGEVVRPTVTAEAPTGAVKALLMIYTPTAGLCSMAIDAVQLEENSTATPYTSGTRVAGQANIRRAIDAVKPAGLQYIYSVTTDFTYDDLNAAYTTYNAMDASAATYNELEEE